MKIEIFHDGIKYESPHTKGDTTVQELTDFFYNNMVELDAYKMELKGGGMLILGRDAMQSAAITVLP